jgi:hypothetical protein
MARFCAMIAEAIHLHSDKMVTVGSACLKWHSSKQPPAEAHYWSDSFLKAAYNKPEAYLDFYQIHYYDWMFNPDWGYDPFQSGKSAEFWELDKPTIIGESPGMEGKYTVEQMVNNAYQNGYAGIMPWSYYANDGHGTWDNCKAALKAFRDAHASIVDFECTSTSTEKISNHPEDKFTSADLFRPGRIKSSYTIKVFDTQGRLILKRSSGKTVPRSQITSHKILIYQVAGSSGNLVKTGKFVIE